MRGARTANLPEGSPTRLTRAALSRASPTSAQSCRNVVEVDPRCQTRRPGPTRAADHRPGAFGGLPTSAGHPPRPGRGAPTGQECHRTHCWGVPEFLVEISERLIPRGRAPATKLGRRWKFPPRVSPGASCPCGTEAHPTCPLPLEVIGNAQPHTAPAPHGLQGGANLGRFAPVNEDWLRRRREVFAAGNSGGPPTWGVWVGGYHVGEPVRVPERVLRNPQRRYSTNRPRHGSNSRDSDEKPALFD